VLPFTPPLQAKATLKTPTARTSSPFDPANLIFTEALSIVIFKV